MAEHFTTKDAVLVFLAENPGWQATARLVGQEGVTSRSNLYNALNALFAAGVIERREARFSVAISSRENFRPTLDHGRAPHYNKPKAEWRLKDV